MGVRGLTTYIAKRAEKFLEPYELHDCNLVIDGDNLASQLFKRTEYRLCCFGGNYDSYFVTVVNFFQMLKKCNVQPYVILDGGYEQRKMKTVRNRLLGRITTIKNIKPLDSRRLSIPLMMREVFVDALRSSGVPLYRCMFEADDEIAILARKLKCPVFSYDSDFYIHNVLYIPNVTITHKVYKKTVKNEKNYEIQILNNSKSKKGREKMKKIIVQEKSSENDQTTEADTQSESYYYMDCSIYQIENLVEQRKLKNEMLPLFATLIGNDYVERKMFRKFYSGIKLTSHSKNNTPQQQRIEKMFEWLKNESLQSAMSKIIDRIQFENRKPLIRQIKAAMSGYNSEKSVAFEYFGLEEDEIDEDDIDLGFALDEFLLEKEKPQEESDQEEQADEEIAIEEVSDVEATEQEDKEETEEEEEEESVFELPEDAIISEESTRPHYSNSNNDKFQFPDWFKAKYQNAELPRFVADLIFSKLYINYPQVEDVLQKDSNEISLDILFYVFALLQYPEQSRLSYLTRTVRTTSYHFKIYAVDKMPIISDFDPLKRKNVQLFSDALRNLTECDQILKEVSGQLPDHLKLYALAVIYWMERSPAVTECHLHSVLLGYLLLKVIDKSAGHLNRDAADFQKKHGKHVTLIKKEYLANVKNESKPDPFLAITRENYQATVKSVTKNEALLALTNLVTYTTIGEKLQRRHVDFSRSLMHTFAQLQSVFYNLYTLNVLANLPFEQLRMSQCFNGFFIYQMFVNLKLRSVEPLIYISNHLFQHSPNLLALYVRLFSFCGQFSMKFNVSKIVGNLREQKVKASAGKKVAHKRGRKKNKESKNEVQTQEQDEEDSENSEFVDLNNSFSKLLSI